MKTVDKADIDPKKEYLTAVGALKNYRGKTGKTQQVEAVTGGSILVLQTTKSFLSTGRIPFKVEGSHVYSWDGRGRKCLECPRDLLINN